MHQQPNNPYTELITQPDLGTHTHTERESVRAVNVPDCVCVGSVFIHSYTCSPNRKLTFESRAIFLSSSWRIDISLLLFWGMSKHSLCCPGCCFSEQSVLYVTPVISYIYQILYHFLLLINESSFENDFALVTTLNTPAAALNTLKPLDRRAALTFAQASSVGVFRAQWTDSHSSLSVPFLCVCVIINVFSHQLSLTRAWGTSS